MGLPTCEVCGTIMRVGTANQFTQVIYCPKCGRTIVQELRKKETRNG